MNTFGNEMSDGIIDKIAENKWGRIFLIGLILAMLIGSILYVTKKAFTADPVPESAAEDLKIISGLHEYIAKMEAVAASNGHLLRRSDYTLALAIAADQCVKIPAMNVEERPKNWQEQCVQVERLLMSDYRNH